MLYRHWQSVEAPIEGFIREFSPDKSLVRITTTKWAFDAGIWHRAHELRVDAVLEEANAPTAPTPQTKS